MTSSEDLRGLTGSQLRFRQPGPRTLVIYCTTEERGHKAGVSGLLKVHDFIEGRQGVKITGQASGSMTLILASAHKCLGISVKTD